MGGGAGLFSREKQRVPFSGAISFFGVVMLISAGLVVVINTDDVSTVVGTKVR